MQGLLATLGQLRQVHKWEFSLQETQHLACAGVLLAHGWCRALCPKPAGALSQRYSLWRRDGGGAVAAAVVRRQPGRRPAHAGPGVSPCDEGQLSCFGS